MAQLFIILDALNLCGLNIPPVPAYLGQSITERFTTDIFQNSFETCQDMTFEDFDSTLKAYANLPTNSGRIRIFPAPKSRIQALIHWVKGCYRTGLDPSLIAFPVGDAVQLIGEYHSHQNFIKSSNIMSEKAKPQTFSKDMFWEDWVTTFNLFLRTIPGRYCVPLNYVIHDAQNHALPINATFIDRYVAMAPLFGDAFTDNARIVHTFIVSLIIGNEVAEAKISPYKHKIDGHLDYMALKAHYEGHGPHAIKIQEADNFFKNLHYTGEKQPTMYWDLFERKLTGAFTSYEKHYGHSLHPEDVKLKP